jgi:hypothetical protein
MSNVGFNNIGFYDKSGKLLHKTTQAELMVNQQTNFNGWTCYTPKFYLHINWTGDVWDSSCKQRKHVGNIYDDFQVSTEPILCEQNFCWCFSDIRTTKIKDPSVTYEEIHSRKW